MSRFPWRPIVVPAACCLAFTAGAFLVHAQTSLSDGWIKFPDGTIQSTATGNCVNPADRADKMIRVGGVCIDVFEASVWSKPNGGVQYGVAGDDYPCSDNGQDCVGLIYARSVEAVTPSQYITWFQAQAALANSGKRLPTNAEWQMAVAGTPDPGDTPKGGDCNVDDPGAVEVTGQRENCLSSWGHHDMVGNVWEWVADWDDDSTGACAQWSSTFGDDISCVGLGEGETNSHFPGALFRGGVVGIGHEAGPFVVGTRLPSFSLDTLGFRGAR